MAHMRQRVHEADGSKRSDFPIICESCLGYNPSERMTKADCDDKVCKSCTRPLFANEHDRKTGAGLDYEFSFRKIDTITKLPRTTPFYNRNRPHICTFYMRGECTRGSQCIYRHGPEKGFLTQQEIKDRYYGVDDPVVLKLLGKGCEMSNLESPSVDPPRMGAIISVKSFFVNLIIRLNCFNC